MIGRLTSFERTASPERAEGNHVATTPCMELREKVFDQTTGQMRPFGSTPLLSSAPLQWQGFLLEEHRLPDLKPDPILWINNIVLVQLQQAITLEHRNGAARLSQRLLPGQVTIIPAQTATCDACAEPLNFLLVSLDPRFMSTACYELAVPSQFQLAQHYGIEDPLITELCLALKKEVEQNGISGKLYSESLATSLAVHLATRYARRCPSPASRARNGSTPYPVRRAIEFIHDQLGADYSLSDLAAIAGLSTFHFARVFKQTVGLPPYQYVIQQRLEAAKQLMLSTRQPLAQVAAKVGFYDHAHFARHFKRLNGLTAKEFLKRVRAGV